MGLTTKRKEKQMIRKQRRKCCDAEDKILGQKLKAIRITKGYSQERLGEALGVTFQQIQKMEAGKNRLSLKDANTICQTLNITPAYFFETYENRPAFTDKKARLTKLFSTLDNHSQELVLTMIAALPCEYRG